MMDLKHYDLWRYEIHLFTILWAVILIKLKGVAQVMRSTAPRKVQSVRKLVLEEEK